MGKLYDWVKQTVSSTGTGAITLSTAVSTYITMADAGLTDGDLIYYTIVDGNNRERGIGTYSTTGPTLTRTFIQGKLESGTYTENPGTGLNLTLAAIVGCSPVAATHNFRGCLLTNTTDRSIPDNTPTILSWDTEIYDTDGFHDLVTNTDRITIPANKGIKIVQLFAQKRLQANISGRRYININLNGSPDYPGSPFVNYDAPSTGSSGINIVSGFVPVVDNDYFSVTILQNSGVSLSTEDTAGQMWFGLRVIE